MDFLYSDNFLLYYLLGLATVVLVAGFIKVFILYKKDPDTFYKNVEEIKRKEYRKKIDKMSREYPTREMFDRYYRSGNRRCLYDENFRP